MYVSLHQSYVEDMRSDEMKMKELYHLVYRWILYLGFKNHYFEEPMNYAINLQGCSAVATISGIVM
jgi:hypothetical protein